MKYEHTECDCRLERQLGVDARAIHDSVHLFWSSSVSEETLSETFLLCRLVTIPPPPPPHRKLLDPGLSACSRQSMFLNLLYKSLKADVVLRRVRAFVKRLLQVSCEQNATFACGALFLVSEVMKAKPGLRLMLQENEVRSASSGRRRWRRERVRGGV